MNKLTQQGATSRDQLLKMAEKQLIKFEKREIAFRRTWDFRSTAFLTKAATSFGSEVDWANLTSVLT
jgi:hypothetical protein